MPDTFFFAEFGRMANSFFSLTIEVFWKPNETNFLINILNPILIFIDILKKFSLRKSLSIVFCIIALTDVRTIILFFFWFIL